MTENLHRPVFNAVLPLAIGGERNDLARAIIQGRSLRHFFRRDELLRVSVVGRAGELQQIADALKPLETPWLQYNVVDEATIDPGLPESKVVGWYKQQVIKMAAPEWLGANFWMTLDADVVCTRLIGIDDLLPGGRALLWVDELPAVPIFAQWSWSVRELLGMVGPPATLAMGVTPLIYAAPIMRAAHQAIEAVHGRPWKDVLLDPAIAGGYTRRYGHGWAENQIYYAIGARLGLLRTCHAFSGIDVPQRLHAHGIWRTGEWSSWNEALAFDPAQPGFFAVCNSYTGVPAEVVAEKIQPYLEREPQPSAPPPSYWMLDEQVEYATGGHALRYRILSRRPLVILGPYDENTPALRNVLSRGVLDPFRRQPAVVLIALPWSRETVSGCKLLAARIARCQREAPLHRFVLLGNTEVEVELLRQLGVEAVLVSHNSILDERHFLGNAEAEPEFDAVYNAAFHPAKRHELAAQIDSLALLYANWHDLPEYRGYVEETMAALPRAVHLNVQADGSYLFIPREQLGAQLQRARVGLCLSEIEGAMRASIEYLFAGLPVVSTFNIGGRDQFFDDDLCAVVPPSPDLVAAAVRAQVARRLPREHVRKRTLHKLAAHRERLMQAVLRAVAAGGHSGRPHIVWPWLDGERVASIEEFHRDLQAV